MPTGFLCGSMFPDPRLAQNSNRVTPGSFSAQGSDPSLPKGVGPKVDPLPDVGQVPSPLSGSLLLHGITMPWGFVFAFLFYHMLEEERHSRRL